MSEPLQLAVGMIVATLSALGYGLLTARLLRLNDTSTENTLASDGISGIAILAALFMAAHFFWPLRQTVNLIVLLPGAICFPFFFKRRFLLELPFLAIMIWWAFRFTRSGYPVWDHGLYHLQSTLWNTLEPVIPGLANIHARLGFNSSTFVLAAGLNSPMFGGWHLALVSPMLFEGMVAATLVLSIRFAAERIARLYSFIVVIVLLFEPKWLLQWSYLSPDPVITMGIFYVVLLYLQKRTSWLFLAVPFLITVKLSAAPLLLLLDWKRFRTHRLAATAGALLLFIWVGRNIALSGHLLFPVPATRLPVSWAVPKDLSQNTAAWITSWARQPGKRPEETRGLGWIRPWANRVYANEAARSAFEIFCIGILFLVWSKALRTLDWWLFLAIALALLFWFISAPDPRFGIGFLFAIAFLSLAYGVESIGILHLDASNAWILIAVLVFGMARMAAVQVITEWPKLEQPEVRPAVTGTGDKIWAPVPPEDRCWAVIPCSPEPEAIRYYPDRAKMTFDPSRPSLR
jgi:hypothetical protein